MSATNRPPSNARKAMWFVALWAAGVTALAVVALAIKMTLAIAQ